MSILHLLGCTCQQAGTVSSLAISALKNEDPSFTHQLKTTLPSTMMPQVTMQLLNSVSSMRTVALSAKNL